MRDSRRPGDTVAMAITAGLALLAAACSGGPRSPEAATLRLPGDTDAAAMHAETAQSAAPVHVKVTISARAHTRTGGDGAPAPRVVNGASGVLVDPAGYVLTAAHIARSTALRARVTTADGRTHSARILSVDAGNEMALLEITTSGERFPAATPGAAVRRGQTVLAIGSPDNRAGGVSVGTVTHPALDARIRYGRFGFTGPMQLDLRVEPGYSGGPVLDAQGKLVGMVIGFDLRRTTADTLVNTGVSYAIPVAGLMDFYRARIE